LVDQNGNKKVVNFEKNSGHFQLFYFSKTAMYVMELELDFAREK
jgi:hypothetical protein